MAPTTLLFVRSMSLCGLPEMLTVAHVARPAQVRWQIDGGTEDWVVQETAVLGKNEQLGSRLEVSTPHRAYPRCVGVCSAFMRSIEVGLFDMTIMLL